MPFLADRDLTDIDRDNRTIEIIFIGQQLDVLPITKKFDSCLLNKNELYLLKEFKYPTNDNWPIGFTQ